MNFDDINKLVNLVKTARLSEIEIEENGVKLRISNGETGPLRPDAPVAQNQFALAHGYGTAASANAAEDLHRRGGADEEEGFSFIKSPMVGTFYSAPAPDAPNYVEVASEIDTNTVVCIVEAMKVMNEIQADARGVIADILVKNGQTVEYGQPLFKVKKI
ncbi:MAG: acetyl-CoA carboxylase biotin carboxyl carrier protein [Puniceicoccales bacterium]|nr:acetyl-CoA carboxylase biotin carboxyl carrier protein [Puniceicoccales bacterium]